MTAPFSSHRNRLVSPVPQSRQTNSSTVPSAKTSPVVSGAPRLIAAALSCLRCRIFDNARSLVGPIHLPRALKKIQCHHVGLGDLTALRFILDFVDRAGGEIVGPRLLADSRQDTSELPVVTKLQLLTQLFVG